MSFCNKICDLVKPVVGITLTGGIAGLGAGTASWIGYSVTQVGFATGFGLGAVGGVSALIASTIFEKLGFEKGFLHLAASTVVAGAAIYGASAGAAALGFIAAPVTVPTAIILTVSSIGAFIIFGFASECCSNEDAQESRKSLHPRHESATASSTRRAQLEGEEEEVVVEETQKPAPTASSTATPPSNSASTTAASLQPPSSSSSSSTAPEIIPLGGTV